MTKMYVYFSPLEIFFHEKMFYTAQTLHSGKMLFNLKWIT